MFGRKSSSVLDREANKPVFGNMFDAVDFVIEAQERQELTVHGTTISGHRPLVSVGAHDAIHDRVLHLCPRFICSYGETHFITIVIFGRDGDREMFKGTGDYLRWAGTHCDLNFDTVSWQVNLHRN